MWKSILSVVAGIVALTVTSFAIEWIVNPLLIHLFPADLPNEGALAGNVWVRTSTLAYSLACVAFGGYVCARLAPRSPMSHALAMGLVQIGMTVLAMLSLPGLASLTVWIVTALLSLPAAVFGGWFHSRRSQGLGAC